MELEIRVDGAGGASDEAIEQTLSLYRWLREDPDLLRSARVAMSTPPGEGQMSGAVLDVINLVATQGIALGNLALAYFSWRGSRPRPPAITITSGGVTITLADGSPDQLRQALEALDRTARP